jgi:GT2 family glycosyltransferase
VASAVHLPTISILIVNYRSTPLLRRCLASIGRSTVFRQTHTIVVDNASPEFAAPELEAAFAWATFLPQPTNLTFTAGSNLAFEHATGDYVLLLNPDTELEPGALESALAHFQERPEMAAISGYLLNDDGTLQRYYRRLPTAGDVPVMLMGRLFRHTPRGRRYLMQGESFVGATAVEQPPGACLLVPRHVVDRLLLDPVFFNYGSDVELCARLLARGPIMVFDDVRCRHRRGGAGVHTSEVGERLRLAHDLTWGIRRLFRHTSRLERLYVEFWLWVFWLGRIGQAFMRRPASIGLGVSTARRALAGQPPTYEW